MSAANVIPFKKPAPSIPPDILDSLDKTQIDLIGALIQFPHEKAITDLHWGWVAPARIALKYLEIAKRRALEINAGVLQEIEADPNGSQEVIRFLEAAANRGKPETAPT